MYKSLAKNSSDSNVNRRFVKDEKGLLYFIDPDYQPRLCVPKSQQNFILKEAHKNPMESSHAGPERLWQQLSQKFYWRRMKADILAFTGSCDVCQKTKFSNFNKFGFLIPNPIPLRPYQSVSMDFIVNLPWSNHSISFCISLKKSIFLESSITHDITQKTTPATTMSSCIYYI